MVQTAQAQVAAAPCPERAAVLAELATLSEVQDDFAAAVQLTDREDGTWLVLGPAGDRDLRERRLATEGDCAQRARVAAVVLAAWGADLRGPLMPPGLRLPVEPPAPVTPIPLAAPRARREKSLELALMVRPTTPQTLGASLGGRFTLVPSWERVGVRLQLGAHASARTELTADAAASWSRAFAALSPSLRVLASPRAHVYVETGVAAALVIARGEDVMTTRRDQAPDFAVQGGLASTFAPSDGAEIRWNSREPLAAAFPHSKFWPPWAWRWSGDEARSPSVPGIRVGATGSAHVLYAVPRRGRPNTSSGRRLARYRRVFGHGRCSWFSPAAGRVPGRERKPPRTGALAQAGWKCAGRSVWT